MAPAGETCWKWATPMPGAVIPAQPTVQLILRSVGRLDEFGSLGQEQLAHPAGRFSDLWRFAKKKDEAETSLDGFCFCFIRSFHKDASKQNCKNPWHNNPGDCRIAQTYSINQIS